VLGNLCNRAEGRTWRPNSTAELEEPRSAFGALALILAEGRRALARFWLGAAFFGGFGFFASFIVPSRFAIAGLFFIFAVVHGLIFCILFIIVLYFYYSRTVILPAAKSWTLAI
jgi:hypothetical protein